MSRDQLTAHEESIGFYYELGLAIATWAHVEDSLSWLYALNFGLSKFERAQIAFFSIESFRSKLQAADRTLRHRFRLPALGADRLTLEFWGQAFSDLESLAKTRNKLAHYPVVIFPDARAGRRYALVPRHSKPPEIKQRTPKPPSGSLCIKDIVHARLQFSALTESLKALFDATHGRKAPPPASSALKVSAPETAKLTRQIRTICQQPPQPSEG